jgi:hypothetical protein
MNYQIYEGGQVKFSSRAKVVSRDVTKCAKYQGFAVFAFERLKKSCPRRQRLTQQQQYIEQSQAFTKQPSQCGDITNYFQSTPPSSQCRQKAHAVVPEVEGEVEDRLQLSQRPAQMMAPQVNQPSKLLLHLQLNLLHPKLRPRKISLKTISHLHLIPLLPQSLQKLQRPHLFVHLYREPNLQGVDQYHPLQEEAEGEHGDWGRMLSRVDSSQRTYDEMRVNYRNWHRRNRHD